MKINHFIPMLLIMILLNQCSRTSSSPNGSSLFISQIAKDLDSDDEITQTWIHDHKFDDLLVLVKVKANRPYDLSQRFALTFDLTEISDDQKSRSNVVISLFEKAGFLNGDQREHVRAWIRDSHDGVVYMVVLSKENVILLGKSDQ